MFYLFTESSYNGWMEVIFSCRVCMAFTFCLFISQHHVLPSFSIFSSFQKVASVGKELFSTRTLQAINHEQGLAFPNWTLKIQFMPQNWFKTTMISYSAVETEVMAETVAVEAVVETWDWWWWLSKLRERVPSLIRSLVMYNFCKVATRKGK